MLDQLATSPISLLYLVFLGHDLKISQGTMEDPGPPLVQVTGTANCYLGTIRNLFQGPTCKNIWPIAATSFAWRHQANGKAPWTHNTRLPVFLLCSLVIRKLKSNFYLVLVKPYAICMSTNVFLSVRGSAQECARSQVRQEVTNEHGLRGPLNGRPASWPRTARVILCEVLFRCRHHRRCRPESSS